MAEKVGKIEELQKLSQQNVVFDHHGQPEDLFDFDLGVPPSFPFALPSLPDFHLPKQIMADRGTTKSKSTKYILKHVFRLEVDTCLKPP